MKNTSLAWNILPIILLVLQTYILIKLTTFVLHRTKLLKRPYSGIDYSEAVLSASFLLGAFILSITDVAPFLQSFTIYQNNSTDLWQPTVIKFSQYFIVLFAAVCIFIGISYFNLKFFFDKTFSKDSSERDLPSAILAAVITIGFSLLIREIMNHWLDILTPKAFNFN